MDGPVSVPFPIPGQLTLYAVPTERGLGYGLHLPDGRWIAIDLRPGPLAGPVGALLGLRVREIELLVDTDEVPGREYAGRFEVRRWWRPEGARRLRHWSPRGSECEITALEAEPADDGPALAVAVRWGSLTVLIGGQVGVARDADGGELPDRGWLGLCHAAFAAGRLDLLLSPLVVAPARGGSAAGFSPIAWALHTEAGPVPLVVLPGPVADDAPALMRRRTMRAAIAGRAPEGVPRGHGWRAATPGERPGAFVAVAIAPDGALTVVTGRDATLLRRPL
jgi:hypothetical protein